jgi:hypothetical protein
MFFSSQDMAIHVRGGHLGGHLGFFSFPEGATLAPVRSLICMAHRCKIHQKTLHEPYFQVKAKIAIWQPD